MNDLSQIQRALTHIPSFAALEPIVMSTTADVSFWGVRYIRSSLYDGVVPIDVLAACVDALVEKYRWFEGEELTKGKRIEQKIAQLYAESDTVSGNRNYFTQLLCAIRDCWANNFVNWGYGPRFPWTIGAGTSMSFISQPPR